MSVCYIYVVDRDFGFAPNPFHRVCTLATCKPGIRARAQVDDWVIGMGGSRLGATGCCIFAMQVSHTVSFQQYWKDPQFRDKRPVRNGSAKMMVGDNIYHRDGAGNSWKQEDSHHSNPDGSPNPRNVSHDTSVDRVLISRRFVYFGREAPRVPQALLDAMGYTNIRNYRVYRDEADYAALIGWIATVSAGFVAHVLGDPFDFEHSALRYVPQNNTVR